MSWRLSGAAMPRLGREVREHESHPHRGKHFMWPLVGGRVLTRLPLLFGGYGSDNDSWRNIAAALHMREAGRYIPSRIPGFPVFEGVAALLAPGGWILTNLASVVAATIGLALFAGLLRDLDVRDRRWPWLALAFGAAMWVQVSQTIDYAYGFAFFIGAWRLVLRSRYVSAGVLLALATGCRASYVVVVGAVLLLLSARRSSWRSFLGFAAGHFPLPVAIVLVGLASPRAHRQPPH